MSIKNFTSFFLILTTVLLFLLFATVYQEQGIQQEIVEKEHHRFKSNLFATELFQSSEDLTRMAKNYVITGDLIYKDYFLKILAIRNGTLARPTDYSITYWYLEGIGELPAVVSGERIALVDLIRKEGLSDEELGLLYESQHNSDLLVTLELKAFAAMEGYYEDSHGEYSIRGEPDRELAKAIIWGDAYQNGKIKIMKPLKEFSTKVNARTQIEFDAAQDKLRYLILIKVVILALLMIGLMIVAYYTRRDLLNPLSDLTRQAKEIRSGNYAARCQIDGANEVKVLGEDFNRMTAAIERAITRHQQSEVLLQHSESRLKEAQRMAQVGNWEYDFANGAMYWSDEIFHICGIESTTISASYKKALSLIHPDDRKKVHRTYQSFVDTRTAFEISYRILLTNNQLKWVNVRGKTEYTNHNELLRLTGTLQDISERMRIERMKSEFIAMVSHELRTPLTAIRGSLGIIKSGITGKLPEEVRQLIEIASRSCDRLIIMVNDLLDIEKIEAGKMQFRFKPHLIQSVILETIKENQAYADQFDVTLKLMNELPNAAIFVDGDRIMQVFNNLLSNAAKFSTKGETVEVRMLQKEMWVCVMVSNKGNGISKNFKDKVFDKFSQSDSSDSRQKGGTGLGLAITKELVEAMNGTITFDSEPDGWTTFSVEFPICLNIDYKNR